MSSAEQSSAVEPVSPTHNYDACNGAVTALRVAVSKVMRRIAQAKPNGAALWEPADSPTTSNQSLPPISPKSQSLVVANRSPPHGRSAMRGGGAQQECLPSGAPVTHDDVFAAKFICAIVDSDQLMLSELMQQLQGVKDQRDQWRCEGTAGKLRLLPSIDRQQKGLDLSHHPTVVREIAPYTLLHCAAIADDPRIVEELLAHEHAVRLVGSLDVELRGPFDETALHLAASLGSAVLVRALIAAGASPHVARRRRIASADGGPKGDTVVAVSPLHDAVMCAASRGTTPADIVRAAHDTGRRKQKNRSTGGAHPRTANADGSDPEGLAHLCVLLRCAAGGSDASSQWHLPPKANELLVALGALVPSASVFAPLGRHAQSKVRGSKAFQKKDVSSMGDSEVLASRKAPPDTRAFALSHRRLHDAIAPSFAPLLRARVRPLNTNDGTAAATTQPRMATTSHDVAVQPQPSSSPVIQEGGGGVAVGSHVAFKFQTPVARLVTVLTADPNALLPCPLGALTGNSSADEEHQRGSSPKRAKGARQVSQSRQQGHHRLSMSMASAASLRRDQRTPSPRRDRSVVIRDAVPQGAGTPQPLAASDARAAPAPIADDVPAYMRPLNRSPKRVGSEDVVGGHRMPQTQPNAEGPAGTAHGTSKLPKWGTTSPTAASPEGFGVVVGAVRVAPTFSRETGFVSDVLVLVQTTNGAGIACDPPAADWPRGSKTASQVPAVRTSVPKRAPPSGRSASGASGAPASADDKLPEWWLQRLVASVTNHRPATTMHSGDLAVVPMSSLRIVSRATEASSIDHQLRASGTTTTFASPNLTAAKQEIARLHDDGKEMRRMLRHRRDDSRAREDEARIKAARAVGVDWRPPR